MCLIKTHKFPKTTFRPKTVYKLLCVCDGELITPTVGMVVKLGETIKAKKRWNLAISQDEICEEGVHAYVNLRNAACRCYGFRHIFIAKIPAFTFYWEGTCGEIAAKRMKVIKMIY